LLDYRLYAAVIAFELLFAADEVLDVLPIFIFDMILLEEDVFDVFVVVVPVPLEELVFVVVPLDVLVVALVLVVVVVLGYETTGVK